jgi:hypothetical protein
MVHAAWRGERTKPISENGSRRGKEVEEEERGERPEDSLPRLTLMLELTGNVSP